MRFQAGQNKFRILDKPITGFVAWDKSGEKPVVFRAKDRSDDKLKGLPDIKAFIAMKVYNYDEKAVQVLEVTQKTIIAGIVNYSRDPEWGDPSSSTTGYRFTIEKSGSGMETRYELRPGKAMALPDEIIDADKPVNLDALYSGYDPFESEVQSNAPASTQSDKDIEF